MRPRTVSPWRSRASTRCSHFRTGGGGLTPPARPPWARPERGVVLLIGNLGAGNTTLAKGIVLGRGAAAADEVSSPTFTLIHEYGTGARVYHIDLYRLDEPRQVATLGLEEIFDRDALVLI